MKRYTLMLLFLHFTFYVFSQNTDKVNCNRNRVDSIIVAYVDFQVYTISNVLCHDFYNTFSDVKYVIIRDEVQIKELIGLLNSLKQISNEEYIDTRAKLYVYKKNEIMPVCIGRNSILYKNIYYHNTSRFINSFYKIVNKSLVMKEFSGNIDIDKPTFPGGIDSLYSAVRVSLNGLNKCSIKDTLRLLIEFNIDNKGNGTDIKLRNRDEKNSIDTLLMKNCVGREIESIIAEKLRWSPSKWRQSKIKTYIPITLYPNN